MVVSCTSSASYPLFQVLPSNLIPTLIMIPSSFFFSFLSCGEIVFPSWISRFMWSYTWVQRLWGLVEVKMGFWFLLSFVLSSFSATQGKILRVEEECFEWKCQLLCCAVWMGRNLGKFYEILELFVSLFCFWMPNFFRISKL